MGERLVILTYDLRLIHCPGWICLGQESVMHVKDLLVAVLHFLQKWKVLSQ